MINADDVEPMPESEPDAGFWSQTDTLAHIHKFARSRGASPYATLGSVLRRTTGCIEPDVVLPATVGGRVSLNLFTIPVGVSGAGKDIANAAGTDACEFHQWIGKDLKPVDEATLIHPGSGEGLARVFSGGKDWAPVTRAHLQVPDVATLEALAGRVGQTLVSQLLAAYMGQPIGFRNTKRESTTAVDAHSYRMCLSVGVQQENAGFFLAREKDGFPQRFLWLPTNDPHAPEPDINPEPILPLQIQLPDLSGAFDRFVLKIPPDVAHEIRHHRWQVLRGVEGIDPLDAHIKLTQLKVAASIAILHGHKEVTEDAWKIADQLIQVSAAVRAGLHAAVEARARRENAARAHSAADREIVKVERLDQSAEERCKRAILGKLQREGRCRKTELYKACYLSIRGSFYPALNALLSCGDVVYIEETDEYEIPTKGV